MKKLIPLVLFCLLLNSSFGQSLLEQLNAYNFNWEKYKDKLPEREAYFNLNEVEIVQLHLSFVIPILRENSSYYNNEVRAKRALLINHLENYRKEGLFPINYLKDERTPVFIDKHETHCAVAFLLKKSGNEALAEDISNEFNLAWIKDIYNPKLLEWQFESGFSLEELKLIQGAYDNYSRDGRTRWDRYEIPQEPQVGVDHYTTVGIIKINLDSIERPDFWLKGEGENGILNGKWIQNASNGNLWIEGFFSQGQRTGQWKEYYQGTKILCRTENWRNHKLNGLRKRFNREGELIEIIDFKNGKAISKINYDLEKGLQYIRKPIGGNEMHTEILSSKGRLLASGIEEIHNPGNLEWFQDIELTALNQFALDAKQEAQPYWGFHDPFPKRSYQNQILVQYKKQGNWTYYRENWTKNENDQKQLLESYPHFAPEIITSFQFINPEIKSVLFDSLVISFTDNKALEMKASAKDKKYHLHLAYFPNSSIQNANGTHYFTGNVKSKMPLWTDGIAEQGEYNEKGEKSGLWKYFNSKGQLYKMEDFRVEHQNSALLGQPEIVSGGF